MSTKFISILFSIVFFAFLITPTVIAIVSESVDVSAFFESSEEDKELGIDKDIEVFLSETSIVSSVFAINNKKNNSRYFFKTYVKPHLNLISPPPQFYIL